METNFGFKQITQQNWLETDPMSTIFQSISSDGQYVLEGKDWVHLFLEPQLEETVPEEIKRLFEVVRGCLIYGYLFYPMYTLAEEQLYRILELAVRIKCKMMNAPFTSDKLWKFRSGVEWLLKQGVIDSNQRVRWVAIVALRNHASHPQMQMIIPPIHVLKTFRDFASHINMLHGREAKT